MNFYSNVIFPRILDKVMSGSDIEALRQSVLHAVTGDVFEIGFGTGLNLLHYPPDVKRITTVDPNPGSLKLAKKRMAQSTIAVVHRTVSAERLDLPVESFDSVISTFTLCSIPNVDAALSEIWRILRRNGRMFFLEHGLSDDPGVQRWQHRLNPLNRVIGDGCNLNRNHREIISRHGFRIECLDNFYLKKAPRFGGYIYRGTAVKD